MVSPCIYISSFFLGLAPNVVEAFKANYLMAFSIVSLCLNLNMMWSLCYLNLVRDIYSATIIVYFVINII